VYTHFNLALKKVIRDPEIKTKELYIIKVPRYVLTQMI